MRQKHFMLKNKNKLFSRAVSILLCFCIFVSAFAPAYTLANALSIPKVLIYHEGEQIENMQLLQSEKAELTAACTSEGEWNYQWQVLADIKSGLWVDIYDGTDKTITISKAMLSSVMDTSGSAYVRAMVKNGDTEGISEPLCVSFVMEEPSTSGNNTTVLHSYKDAGIMTTADEPDNGIILVKINYLDAVTGLPIYTSFSAQIAKGTEHVQIVNSPAYIGYKPYYNQNNKGETDADKCNDFAETVTIDIPSNYSSNEYIINVYYKAVKVSYAVKYYFQNMRDDFYTEDSSLYKLGTAETGTIITDKELEIDRKGFTKIYHYPQAVAGDGSTVFECYYDRNYSMISFDLNGGNGIDPIYARYGTPISVGEPTRAGYIFKGWKLMDATGNYGTDLVEISNTIPAESCTYKAIWEKSDTTYTIVYWLQNADDEEYSHIGSETKIANSDDVIKAEATLEADTPICGQRGSRDSHKHTSTCYPSGFKYYIYDKAKTEAKNKEVTVEGDGSTIINIYYTRQYFTLRFIYAKEYNPAYDVKYPNKYPHAAGYSIVGGSTYGFGNKNTGAYWPNGVGNDYTLSELMQSMNNYDGKSDKWGKVKSLPTLNSDKYTTGVYPAEGEGYDGGNYDYYGDRYFYFDITAPYGADLSAVWPTDVFNKIEVYPHYKNGADKYLENDGWGNYAYLAGWNGEYKVNYSLQKSNSTIKGLFQKLDSSLLFGSSNGKELTYTEDTKTQRKITTTATGSGKEVSSYLNYYIAFFNNGADYSWNIPKEWHYEYYVPVLEGVLTPEQEAALKEAKEPMEVNGLTYYYYETNDVIYQLGAYYITSDNNTTAEHQTQCSLTGFEFAHGQSLKDNPKRAEKIDNGILADGRESFTLRLFYTRKSYTDTKYNYNGVFSSTSGVPYKTYLDKYVLDEEGNYLEPDYPIGLEEGAYSFAGWYTSPGCYDGTEYKKGSRMPDANHILYAKWVPNTYTVNIFKSYDEMLAYEGGDITIEPIETRTVAYGSTFGSIDNPTKEDFDFKGWFYIKNGERTAYMPLNVPVKSDLNIYAEWDSNTAQPYIIHYALENKETDGKWLDALEKVVGAAPEDNHSYTAVVNGETRSYVYLEVDKGYHLEIASPSGGYAYQGNMRTFLPKTGEPFNHLYDGYNNGYYPTVSSHSIAIAYEEDKENPVHNAYTFTYVNVDSVDYKVEYRYIENNELIKLDGVGDSGSGIASKTTSMGVVTERFTPVTDYIADAFYKKLIISVEKDSEGNYVGSKNNVVTFYYSKNSESVHYAIHYMLEDLDGEGYTESSNVTDGIAKIGSQISIEPPEYDGFTSSSTAELKTADQKVNSVALRDGSFTFTVDKTGSELYIYYNRNTQGYGVYYLLDGTDITDLSNIPSENILAQSEMGTAKVGTVVTAFPKAIDGYNCTSVGTKNVTIHSNEKQNYIVFFYTPLSYTVQYKAWHLGGGTFDATSETATEEFTGSTPKASNGYTFAGWYLDKECTKSIGDAHMVDKSTNKLTPNLDNLKPHPEINVFYAKFMPAFGSLSIVRENAEDVGGGVQTFQYKITSKTDESFNLYVTITGNDSLTIYNLPIGDYTIEQQNDWSWRYGEGQKTVNIKKDQITNVTYDDNTTKATWLSGNSKIIKNRKNKE